MGKSRYNDCVDWSRLQHAVNVSNGSVTDVERSGQVTLRMKVIVKLIGRVVAVVVLIMSLSASTGYAPPSQVSLLNVSYDSTRELYQAINRAFAAEWKAKTGQTVMINQVHGGSARQARAVIDGLEADVVTLALAYDIDVIARQGRLLPKNWQSRLADNSSPYTSTIVFLVRKGNPQGIRDWDDIVRPDVQVIAPNPKTSGGARWIFLAAWGYELHKSSGNQAAAKTFVSRVYKNVSEPASGARDATDLFVQRGVGDVLLAWENEALLALKQFGSGKFEIVVPSESILAEPPVAVVDKNADRHRTRKVAQAYLEFLYSDQGQTIIAQQYYRPRIKSVAAQFSGQFPEAKLFTVEEVFGGWQKAQKDYFSDGGVFDQIYGAPQ